MTHGDASEVGKLKTILLVEDQPMIALAASATIAGFGYRVLTSPGGDDAVTKAMQADLVLMDIDLGPGEPGTEIAGRILQRKTMPIVFLTAHTEREMVEKVRGITRYGYIIKNSGDFVLQSSIEMAFNLFDAHELTREHEEELLFQSMVLDQIQDCITITDLNGVINYVNDAECRMLGKDRASLIGMNVRAYGDDAARGATQQEIIKRTIEDGGWRGEVVNYDSVGKELILDTRTQAVYRQGKMVALCGIATEITERKRGEAALLASVRLYRNLVEIMPEGVVIHIDGILTYCNAAAVSIMRAGVPERLVGAEALSFVHPEYRDAARERIARAIATGIPAAPLSEVFIRCDGTPVTVEARAVPITDGSARMVMTVFSDISERIAAANERQRNAEYLQAVLDSAHDAVFVDDADTGEIIDVNRSMCEMYGYTREEALRVPIGALSEGSPPYSQAEAIAHLEATRSSGPQVFEWRARRKDGSLFWVEIRTRFVVIGGLNRFVVVARDITEQKRDRERIERLLVEKDALLKEVHHRIKNNMAAVSSLLSLQAHNSNTPEAVDAIITARGRIQSMMTLYERLYRSDSISSMSLKHYLSALIDEIAEAVPSAGGITVTQDVADIALPVSMLFPLGIIVNELITNAIKYAFPDRAGGSIQVSVAREGNAMRLMVSDNGCGHAGDAAPASGFGLKLVGLLVVQIEGKLRIEHENGTRCTVEFTL